MRSALALRGRLDEGEGRGPPPYDQSVDALNHYLLGRFHWNKRNEAGFHAGIAHFGERDPDRS